MKGLNTMIWSHQSIEYRKRFPQTDVSSSDPLRIHLFRDLVRMIAEISFQNPEYVLFFRGQTHRHLKNRNLVDSFYPSIYRSPKKRLSAPELEGRFKRLDECSSQLLAYFRGGSIRGRTKLGKFPELLWAILQHYEVCPTPLLDVTHSLRVAASFALRNAGHDGFLYVFAFPYPNGSITYSVESELIIIRLLSICPPAAQRPHFQEGFLVGTFPSRSQPKRPSLDIGVRLVAKFELAHGHFWDKDFQEIPQPALFPNNDEIKRVCDSLHDGAD